MKNMTIQIRWMMGMLVLLLAGCDKESDDMLLTFVSQWQMRLGNLPSR